MRRTSEVRRTLLLIIRLKVSDALPGRLAIYGERFGRYPVEPMVIFEVK